MDWTQVVTVLIVQLVGLVGVWLSLRARQQADTDSASKERIKVAERVRVAAIDAARDVKEAAVDAAQEVKRTLAVTNAIVIKQFDSVKEDLAANTEKTDKVTDLVNGHTARLEAKITDLERKLADALRLKSP